MRKKYLNRDLELAIIIFSLQIWNHCLYRVHVDVFTDQTSLQYVFTQKYLNLFLRKWLELLKVYDISVVYHWGKANIVADDFSRLSLESVSYVADNKKDSFNKVHQHAKLGVLLVDLVEGSVWVHNLP